MASLPLLAIETSCDETSVAIVLGGTVLANVTSSQIALHSEYGGVVPELATREHLRNLVPVAREALQVAGVSPDSLRAVAATQGPGLPSALLIGFHAGQALAFALCTPFFGVHHHEAHLYSPWISGKPPREDLSEFQPNVSLVVSGGHTLLVHVEAVLKHRVLGSTIDDAAGECFDKVAKLIGLSYPGGPELDRLAQDGDATAYAFPRPLLSDPGDQFSFSGLKTAVRYFLRDHSEVLDSVLKTQNLCASVQAAIVDVLVAKTIRAAVRLGVGCVTASGGVTCNSSLRRRLAEACRQARLVLHLADPSLCTDNAAMVGILAERKLLSGCKPTPMDGEIHPGWALV